MFLLLYRFCYCVFFYYLFKFMVKDFKVFHPLSYMEFTTREREKEEKKSSNIALY